MSKKSNRNEHSSRSEKRQQFSGNAPKPVRTWLIPVSLVVTTMGLVAFGLVKSLQQPVEAGPESSEAQKVSVTPTGQIRIPLVSLNDPKAKFFEHVASHGIVRFFAMRGSDGVYRTALDACEICYSGHKGYVQQDDLMVCRKCGQSFSSAIINEVSGGCHPIGVPRAVENGDLVIDVADLVRIDAKHALIAGRDATVAK